MRALRPALGLLLTLLLLCLLSPGVLAMDVAGEFGAEAVREALPESAREVLQDTDPENVENTPGLLQKLGQALRDALRSALSPAIRAGRSLVLISFFSALAGLFAEKGGKRVIPLAGTVALTLSAAAPMETFLQKGVETVTELSGFSAAVLPVMASVSAGAGAVGSAPAKYAAAALYLSVVQTASQQLLVPLIYAYVGVSAGACATGSPALKKTAGLVKRLAVLLMTGAVLTFLLYLSLTGMVTGTADAALTRVLKTTVSTALPVVGGIVSDAAASVAAGIGVLRSSVGLFGLLAVCAVCVGPFSALGVYWLVFRLCQALAECFDEGGVSAMIGAVSDAFAMILGLAGTYGVMLFFSLYSLMKVVSAP